MMRRAFYSLVVFALAGFVLSNSILLFERSLKTVQHTLHGPQHPASAHIAYYYD